MTWEELLLWGALFVLVAVVLYWAYKRFFGKPPAPKPPPINKGSLVLLTATTGTQILDSMPYLASGADPQSSFPQNSVANSAASEDAPYLTLVNGDISSSVVDPKPDWIRAQYLAYFQAVFPALNMTRFQQLSTTQMQGLYRSLAFYYVTSDESQPDGGWYGDYWSNRVLSDFSHSDDGCTQATAAKNEALLFDAAWGSIEGSRTDMWGNRIFLQNMQGSMRRGMRNSPQVLAERPPWGSSAVQYGAGGFPGDVYLEMLMFPIEHPDTSSPTYQYGMGYPTGAEAKKMLKNQLAYCPDGYEGYPCDGNGNLGSLHGNQPLIQPDSPDDMPYATEKPQWFYFSQGNGMFWNTGITAYCYNYVDFFLNAPMGKNSGTYPVGWSQMYPGASKGGLLGLDKNGNIKEHDYTDPVYSMKLVLEYLSRTSAAEACTPASGQPSIPAILDPNTGLPGVGYCAPPCTGSPCSMSGASIFTSHSLDKQVAALMGVYSYWQDYNPQGAKNPGASTWPDSCVATADNPSYPSRTVSQKAIDNRYIVTGWVNGHFYGFPKESCMCPQKGSCTGKSCSDLKLLCNPFAGGIPGTDPKTGDIIYGKTFSEDDPLTYYDQEGNVIYSTYYGKKLEMDEPTALALTAEMYSCGDTGWENSDYNWPFGSYFSYGQDLGSPGKDLAVQMSMPGYTVTTIQFTATPTSYESGKVQPAYDFEIQWNPIATGSTGPITAVSAVTLDLTADFDGKTQEAGTDLRLYAGQNKGLYGGYVPVNSPAGQTAQAFSGAQMGVTNWTTLNPMAFSVGKPNAMNPAITNELKWT